uniref:DUF834 domain-containing protein n=1 Tax=Oryza glumipatula TaxID=40148 RepID=A0A0E0AFR5_9ORYZ
MARGCRRWAATGGREEGEERADEWGPFHAGTHGGTPLGVVGDGSRQKRVVHGIDGGSVIGGRGSDISECGGGGISYGGGGGVDPSPAAAWRPDLSPAAAGRPDPWAATARRPDPSPATAGRTDPWPATVGRPVLSPATAGRPDPSPTITGMTAVGLGQGSDNDGGGGVDGG